MPSKILVTGAAGFIGFHTALSLLKQNHQVFGLDIINDYYELDLKYHRLKELGIEKDELNPNSLSLSSKFQNFKFFYADLADKKVITDFAEAHKFDIIIHLAAQAGVRYSIENPYAYVHSNLSGFLNVLEACRETKVKHLIYASTSSVYGLNSRRPFKESDAADHPMAFYAATKRSNELMAHSYSHLFQIPTTGLRFFTVYGPWGRPDMAPFLFAHAIKKGEPIKVFNNGDLLRDFTYVDDIVEGIIRLIPNMPSEKNDNGMLTADISSAPFQILNIGNSKPIKLMTFIEILENCLNKSALLDFQPMQPGDVFATHSDSSKLFDLTQFKPKISLEQGLRAFSEWFIDYYYKT